MPGSKSPSAVAPRPYDWVHAMSPPDAPPAPDRPAAPGALTGLNPVQSDAVTHAGGPLLVVAGAGSGKTRVLTTRLAHILATGKAWPGQILAVTFTNKAAEEIASRLASSLGERARKVERGTIHALCARLLREHAEAAGIERGFGVADEEY